MPDGRIVESWPGKGVRVRTLHDWRGVQAFTVPGMTPEQWDRAICFALAEVGCGYDWWSIIRFVSRRHMPSNDKWFCSELVAAALQSAGVRLLSRIEPSEISPSMLSLSPLLVPIRNPIQH